MQLVEKLNFSLKRINVLNVLNRLIFHIAPSLVVVNTLVMDSRLNGKLQ